MSTQNTIILKSQDHWEEWNAQFEGLARGKNRENAPPAGSTRSQSGTPVSFADHQFAWTRYKTRLDVYTRQQSQLDKLREWMQKNNLSISL
ncbi:uncharacterized protein ATNIH1004_008630 [Aspergillus tanneri]|uniref:Uncharacterized protein n=1 Tax=Aspergillus tanneri TaxID=1220188 RepID=A0A5M9MF98_9EURO|nr:uncharacterized protein ATNIH1004_008630 [Aspergillus tanneri]KAA8644426.1 hypothetical protein ATNIH1004_008630 [Aspergillus tanneri]